MRLFDYTQAQHFCAPLPAYQQGVGQSLPTLYRGSASKTVREGSQNFTIHRISLLNNVERGILFGVSQYRRALEMFTPSNAAWSQVSLYYASFFAANAILGMYGVWVGQGYSADVESGIPNHQAFQIHKKNLKGPSGYRGSHEVFWDLYYEGCTSFAPWVPTILTEAIEPVNNNRTWQITSRNGVNYDMAQAFDASVLLKSNPRPKDLSEYGGSLGQQREVTEHILKLAVHFAKEFKVSSFPYEGLLAGDRPKVIRSLVTAPPPNLVTQSILQQLFV
ncbi:hypothetical protein [Edaphobacter sp. DSM 109919]|uniref:Uncharacterized protein n=1 Tax=Edaphobacter paludis TaxID=3035702 RepID=A0AAU7CUB8_9BACT